MFLKFRSLKNEISGDEGDTVQKKTDVAFFLKTINFRFLVSLYVLVRISSLFKFFLRDDPLVFKTLLWFLW